jgi:hypothetical protein
VQADVENSWPFNDNGVLLLKDFKEVLGMFLPTVLHTKSSTTRQNSMGRVWCVRRPGVLGDWTLSVGEDASLRETVHTFIELTVDKSTDFYEIEIKACNDGCWDVFQRHRHVLGSFVGVFR